jgi:tRNA nucleotidyltransferase (CCA-adding enzyme)
MAYSPTRGLCDPFGGRTDLQGHTLRAVGNPVQRFQEDALRILRGVRFAVRFALTPEPATLQAMNTCAPLMENLSRERVFDEFCKLLPLADAEDLCRFAPILVEPIPELGALVGFQQHSPHHSYDAYTHTAHVVAAVPRDLTLRWAALLHDVGKPATFTLDSNGQGHFYGHAAVSAEAAGDILRRLRAPNSLREEVTTLIAQHMTQLMPEKKILRRWLGRLGTQGLDRLLQLQEADMGSKGTGKPAEMAQFPQIRELLAEIQAENACLRLKDLAVNGHDLMTLGITGPAIGKTLSALLEQVIDEALPNEKQALLNALKNQ